jgi:hypothetical protein
MPVAVEDETVTGLEVPPVCASTILAGETKATADTNTTTPIRRLRVEHVGDSLPIGSFRAQDA